MPPLNLSRLKLPAAALAQWSDNFDSYPTGPLVGNGGWESWDNDPGALAHAFAVGKGAMPVNHFFRVDDKA